MNGSTLGFNPTNANQLIQLFNYNFSSSVMLLHRRFKTTVWSNVFGKGQERNNTIGWYGPDAQQFETTKFRPMLEVFTKKYQRELKSLADYIQATVKYYAAATGVKVTKSIDYSIITKESNYGDNAARKEDIYGYTRINTGLVSVVKSIKNSIKDAFSSIDYAIRDIKASNAFLGSTVQQNINNKMDSINKLVNDEIAAILRIMEEEVSTAIAKRKQISVKM